MFADVRNEMEKSICDLDSLNGGQFVRISDYIINLKNVGSFKIEPEKLIFNMAYSTVGRTGYKADFIFIDEYTDEDVETITENEYFVENFIKIFNGSSEAYINKNAIGSFKFEKDKQRYVINFNTVHTYDFQGKQKVMAEFMYAYV